MFLNISYLTLPNILGVILATLIAIFLGWLLKYTENQQIGRNLRWFYALYLAFLPLIFLLPFPTSMSPISFDHLLLSIEWNPFNTIPHHWNFVTKSLHSQNAVPLQNFILHHIGNILIFMPLADFIYTNWFINRRETLVFVMIAALLIEIMQAFVILITGSFYLQIDVTDIFEVTFGAALFLFTSFLIDRYNDKRMSQEN